MNREPLYFLALFVFATFARGEAFLAKHPQKDMIIHALEQRVARYGDDRANHFFIFRKKAEEDWVFWKEKNELWCTDLSPFYETKGKAEITAKVAWTLRLVTPGKIIELDKDVVATPEDVGSSTCLVPKQWVADIVYDCVVHGELLTIERKLPVPPSRHVP